MKALVFRIEAILISHTTAVDKSLTLPSRLVERPLVYVLPAGSLFSHFYKALVRKFFPGRGENFRLLSDHIYSRRVRAVRRNLCD